MRKGLGWKDGGRNFIHSSTLPRNVMYYTRCALFSILVLTLSGLTPMAVESAPHPRFGGQLRYAIFQRVETLDVVNYLNFAELQVAANLYEGLVKRDRFGRTVSAIAQSWTHSEDYRLWTFTIAQNAKFHDGAQVTATDIKRAWERAVRVSWLSAPELATEMPLLAISGAEAYRDNVREGTVKEIVGIRLIDERQLEVTLEKGDALFLAKLTAPVTWITKPRNTAIGRTRPIGTGKFRLAADSVVEEIRLTANNAYVWGRPYLDTVTFRYYGTVRDALFDFESENLDALSMPLAEVTATRRGSNYYDVSHHQRTLIRTAKAVSVYLQVKAESTRTPSQDRVSVPKVGAGLNPSTSPELRKRAAHRTEWYDVLKYAINVDALLRLQYGVELAQLASSDSPLRFNPTKAQRLLTQVAGDDSRPLRMHYAPLPDNTGAAIATRLRRDFLKIGFQVATPNAMGSTFRSTETDLVLFALPRCRGIDASLRKPSASKGLIPLYLLPANLLCHPYIQGVNIGWSGSLICDEVWLGK